MPMPKHIGHPINFGKNLSGLFKQGWWEIPEVMASSCMGLVGIILGIIGAHNYQSRDGDNKEFKSVYMIVRPDDPRMCYFKNPVYTKYK